MLYLIVAASLIYISNAGCRTATLDTDCQSYISQVPAEATNLGVSIVCDERGEGQCTITCPGIVDCATAASFIPELSGQTVTCSSGYCAVATPTPTQSPVPTTSSGTPKPTQPTPAPDPCAITAPVACTDDEGCKTIFDDCVSPSITTSEGPKCIDDPVSDGKMCSISCTTDGQTICDGVNTALAMPSGVVLKCLDATGDSGKVCQAKLDRSCTETSQCEDKLGATVAAVGKALANLDNVTPGSINEEYMCVNNECTITCNDPNFGGVMAIDSDDLCGYVKNSINENVVPGEEVDLECDYADGTNKACIDVGTGVDPVTDEPTTTDEELDCDDDPCGDIQRPECTIVPDSINGKCSVRVEFDIDVCLINKFMKRYDITRDIRAACIQIGGSAEDVCTGGEWAVEAYECYRESGAEFDFYERREHKDDCPGVKVNGECKDKRKNNGNGGGGAFGANIKGAAGLYCDCGGNAQKALEDAKANIIANANAALNFAEEFLEASSIDDAICAEGFGVVEANKLTVTFRDANGVEVVDGIDITGGAMKMCYYMVSVVVLVAVSFL